MNDHYMIAAIDHKKVVAVINTTSLKQLIQCTFAVCFTTTNWPGAGCTNHETLSVFIAFIDNRIT